MFSGALGLELQKADHQRFEYNQIMDQAQQNYQQKLQAEAKKQQMQEMRTSILSQILTPQAKDRLSKIKLVKPEKAMGIQNSLINAAQSGMLKKIISEEELVALLERQSQKQTQAKITFKRRSLDDEW